MRHFVVECLSFVVAGHAILHAQDSQRPEIDWQRGPTTAKIGKEAQIQLPEGMLFADAKGARAFLQMTQNIPSGAELGILTPEKGNWFVIFSFADVGYIKDDEKSSLDADAMLASIKKGTEEANEERRDRGWGELSVVGWIQRPHYDEATHNLEWALEAKDEAGELVANLQTRYLGRRGYMKVELVADSKELEGTIPAFRSVLSGYSYLPESNYKSFARGDKVAEYGLSALVVGGAAAVATKTGLLKALWKFILVGWKLVVAGVLAAGAFLKRLFARRSEAATPSTASNDQ